MTEHEFTKNIKAIIAKDFSLQKTDIIFICSDLIKYINIKTKSANKGSKSRGSFGNLYAIYVLLEDYIENKFDENPTSYNKYPGAVFSKLLKTVRLKKSLKHLSEYLMQTSRAEDGKRKSWQPHSPVSLTSTSHTQESRWGEIFTSILEV